MRKLIVLLLLTSQVVFASKATSKDPSNTNPDDKELCKTPDGPLTLVFDSRSNNWDNDDTVVNIEYQRQTIKVDLKPAFYDGDAAVKSGVGACQVTPAFLIDERRILFLLSRNERPSPSVLVGFVFDFKAKKIVAVSSDLGSTRSEQDNLAIEKIESGVRLKTYRAFKVIKEKRTEQFDWKRITYKDGKLIVRWEKPLPRGFREGP